jgi:hypothetical protein
VVNLLGFLGRGLEYGSRIIFAVANIPVQRRGETVLIFPKGDTHAPVANTFCPDCGIDLRPKRGRRQLLSHQTQIIVGKGDSLWTWKKEWS